MHEASLQSHELFYIWTTPANLKIQLKPSMSEIRNYLVANPIFLRSFLHSNCVLELLKTGSCLVGSIK